MLKCNKNSVSANVCMWMNLCRSKNAKPMGNATCLFLIQCDGYIENCCVFSVFFFFGFGKYLCLSVCVRCYCVCMLLSLPWITRFPFWRKRSFCEEWIYLECLCGMRLIANVCRQCHWICFVWYNMVISNIRLIQRLRSRISY